MTLRTLDAIALSDWDLVPSECHKNAQRWVNRFPGFRSVRGWLIEGGREFGAICQAHSVVQDTTGHLWDVTLETEYPFVVYLGPDSTYDESLLLRGWAQIILPAW
ncbi:hypothetical protein EGA29_19210 [Ralstonia pseudosolanacearum]|uniref:Uncharacterized protein n=1 Tax=Ralstonia pseudosolanacearum TaxID=1310165 RepID=A0A454TM54_9RALS|nr:hypothetical protein EGA29_19210 [Ralstonia pseudosolanacearum]